MESDNFDTVFFLTNYIFNESAKFRRIWIALATALSISQKVLSSEMDACRDIKLGRILGEKRQTSASAHSQETVGTRLRASPATRGTITPAPCDFWEAGTNIQPVAI